MASKAQFITELYERTIGRVTESPDNWLAFLRSACRNYKCRFDEQVLIYAGRPNATAVLEIERWNRQFGRWVNRGATGIAVFDGEFEHRRLKHYFDISDTHESSRSRPVPVWDMRPEFEESVIESLENSFGELDYKDTLAVALISAAGNLVDDNITDYLAELAACTENSFLEVLEDEHVEAIYRTALKNSVAAMLLSRCGIDPADYFSADDFSEIISFSTTQTVNALGIATGDIAEMGLRQIASTVLSIDSRTFAKKERARYSNNNDTAERSFENDRADLHHAGRLPPAQSDAPARTGSTAWEIRTTSGPIPQRESQDFLHQPADDGQAASASRGGGADGEGTAGADNLTDGESGGRDRAAQSDRPDGLGGADEQHPAESRGSDTDGSDLHITPLPTIQEQLQLIETEDDKSSVFSIPQADIDEELCGGSGFSEGKLRIYAFFQQYHTTEEAAKFLKNEYGIGGHSPRYDGAPHQDHDGKGLQLYKDYGAPKLTLSWAKVAKRIGELIATDRYLNPKEKEQFPVYQRQEEERRQRLAEERAVREILSREPAPAQKEQPDSGDTAEYQYHLGATVYLGATEYEILSFEGDTVRLYDTSFPLVNKELPRSEFDRKVRQNPNNNHLKVAHKQQDNEEKPVLLLEPEAEQPYTPKPGDRYEIQGRLFVVDSVDTDWETVSLRDITFQNHVGIPIFRSESLDFIRMYDPIQPEPQPGYETWSEPATAENAPKQPGVPSDEISAYLPQPQAQQPLTPAWEKPKPKTRAQTFDLHPEIPDSQRHNYRITDDALGVGTPREKFAANVAAIKVLKALEVENRFATPAEQDVLAQYVGWGGLSDAFDETKWPTEYLALKELLDADEYAAARESTLTAFYTPPVIIKSIFEALANMGFETGNILEPSCGTGNFMGLLPDSMADSKLYGVELDSISGRIAQQLYQKSSIAVQGFEKTALPDSFFDVAVGNVPFGQFKVADKRYDKNNFLIHDYFFGKALDKVRPGGIIAFITSKGTLDKENPAIRRYIAQRADLLGAIRLPNNTFKANAGTEVTADIIFLQKRDRIIDIEPDWVHLDTDGNGIKQNRYFVEHPEMVLGEMVLESTQYGMDSTCQPIEGADLTDLLRDAVANIHAEIGEYKREEADEEDKSIPADPTVRNFSFTLYDGSVYYRENSRMSPVEVSVTAESRIKGMIELRDCVRNLIEYQTEDYPESEIAAEQARLNRLYDSFSKKYGLLNSRANSTAFSDDSSYCLLCSLEVLDENGELLRKADMFNKRTIKPRTVITSVDTASEALAVSLAEKARVDLSFMSQLTGKSEDELIRELDGVIFRDIKCASDPDHIPKAFVYLSRYAFVTADEYLSGNVRQKLQMVRALEQALPEQAAALQSNITALEAAQPVDLSASEISVRLGATWLPTEDIRQFMFELLEPPRYAQMQMKVHFMPRTCEWNVEGKNSDRGIKAISTYGTNRISAYKIIEETLNLRDVRIFDYTVDEHGNRVPVLNKKETAIAQGKQELIKQAFLDWIWKDPDRRQRLTRSYNDQFNSTRPREYDGSHITFSGINPEITLRTHQVNAIAHILYGGNTLLAHEVGAGKTYEMVAAAMESKRLGLCSKSLIVVPNHLTEQWAAEFLQLYPAANILVATKKDFETKNRKKFCGRIATGDYDAIIIGHSQFEKIPMSAERQQRILEQQLDEVLDSISDLKANKGERFSIKQLERTRKGIEAKLERLNDQSRKDDVVTFEELGVDRLFIDESHFYKNLFLFTKMRNVGGIAQTEAQKSSDLFMKCRYLDELTGGKGIIFATGTPISNSMAELYTVQRYLQYETLQRHGLQHFDAWASTFGETVTAIELSPEGTSYRAKTRFAKFYNLPELMAMFKDVADIQTADTLNLPVPKANYHNVVIQPSEMQSEMVAQLSERADKVRNKMVQPHEDNMLLITNDGRKLALDQRLMNELLPDEPEGKVAACANNVFEIWQNNSDKSRAQLVFCDLSTPKNDGKFNVYSDVRDKLIAKGIPAEQIAFIHEADTETRKKELFAKVRKGQVRVLIGSTQKMGAGTNVQDRLKALHDLDCPWRPSDLTQRSGRIIRQGNQNEEVDIFRYVTEQTFDAYLYQLVENKQRFIAQIMTSKSPVRSAEDVDETALSYAEIKALATGNPHIKEKMDLDIAVARLNVLKSNFLSQKYALEDHLLKHLPAEIKHLTESIAGYNADIVRLEANTPADKSIFAPMTVNGTTFSEKDKAGAALIEACKSMTSPDPVCIGQYRGFELELSFDVVNRMYKVTLVGDLRHTVTLGNDVFGNITRLDNALSGLAEKLQTCEQQLETAKAQMEIAKAELQRPFPGEEELKQKTARLSELNSLLNMDEKSGEILDDGELPPAEEPKKVVGLER